jgi:GNAT superfamily N-acetyltransferase
MDNQLPRLGYRGRYPTGCFMTDTQTSVEIVHGIPEAMRSSAAALYDDAFGAKFAVAISSNTQRLALLADSLNLAFAFGATENNRLVGLAGYKTREGSFTDRMTYNALLKHAGLIRGNWAALVFSLYERSLTSGQLLMDGIVVDASRRGRGSGTRLLNELTIFAKLNEYNAVRLDVIDTNPNARRMYERNGFTATRTESFGCLRWLLGFGASITLVRETENVG